MQHLCREKKEERTVKNWWLWKRHSWFYNRTTKRRLGIKPPGFNLRCYSFSLTFYFHLCSSNDILFSSRMVRWQRKMKRIDSCLWKNIKSSYYHFLQLYVYIVHACKKHTTTVLMSSQEINVIFSADICYWEKYGNTVSISSDLL